MTKPITSNSIFSKLATIIMVGVTALVILQPNWPFVKFAVRYVEWVALAFIAFGLFMITLKQRRLMFAAMLAAASICIYFDQSMPEVPVIPSNQLTGYKNDSGYEIKVGHFNLSNHNGHADVMLDYILAQQSDILTLLEYNQGWDSLLEASVFKAYPYHILRPSFGYSGMAIFSRLPIVPFDSLEVHDSQMYGVLINLDNNLGEIACYLNMLPLVPGIQQNIARTAILEKVEQSINASHIPSIVLGEFSDPNWDNVLRDFRGSCNLYNSRSGTLVLSPCAQFPNFKVPSEHIFYSTSMQCTQFQAIGNPYSDYIGLSGTYRLNETTHAVQ